jgi:hypothetical protein
MSDVATMDVAPMPFRRFTPSIAQDVVAADAPDWHGDRAQAGGRLRAAFWALNVGLASYAPSCAVATLPVWPAQAFLQAVSTLVARGAVRAELPIATQEMVAGLKVKGMPIAALADVLDVERKTVYSWLDDGIEAKAVNYDRLRLVSGLLANEEDGSLRYFHRFWERQVPGGPTLKDSLMASEIDPTAVRAALDALRPAALRSMQADADRKANARERSPAAALTIHLVAGRRD